MSTLVSTYIYVHPERGDRPFYEAFIVSNDGVVEEPTGYISTKRAKMAGENSCFHVKPLKTEVSTPVGKFTLGSSYAEYHKHAASGCGINYVWYLSKNGQYNYIVVSSPGGTRAYSYKSYVWLVPPAGLTCAQTKEWFAERCTYTSSLSKFSTGSGYTRVPVSAVSWPPAVDAETAYNIASSIHWSESLQTVLDTMYYDAVGELKFNMNNIANGAEIAGLLRSTRSLNSLGREISKAAGNLASKSTAKKLGDAWLKYRYAYSTTKSDVEEFLQKTADNEKADTGVLHVGSSLDGFALNMKIAYRPHENSALRSLFEFISMPKRLGLDPSLYNMWDLVPFSFIVDWFIPIGDNLERISNQTWAATMPYVTECLASYKGTVEYWGKEYRVYSRFDFSPSGKWSWISRDGASLLTTTKRGLDVIALTRR